MFSAVAATRAMLGILGSFKWFNNRRFMGAEAEPRGSGAWTSPAGKLWFAISGVAILVASALARRQRAQRGHRLRGRHAHQRHDAAAGHAGRRARRAGGRRSAWPTPSSAVAATRSAATATRPSRSGTESLDATSAGALHADARRALRRRSTGVKIVSASFGRQILRGAILAFVFSMLLIVVYIAFRFDGATRCR